MRQSVYKERRLLFGSQFWKFQSEIVGLTVWTCGEAGHVRVGALGRAKPPTPWLGGKIEKEEEAEVPQSQNRPFSRDLKITLPHLPLNPT